MFEGLLMLLPDGSKKDDVVMRRFSLFMVCIIKSNS